MTESDQDSLEQNRVMRRMLGSEGPELSGEQCFELLDEYVELKLTAGCAEEQIPGMRAHLQGCSACCEEHDSLLALLVGENPA